MGARIIRVKRQRLPPVIVHVKRGLYGRLCALQRGEVGQYDAAPPVHSSIAAQVRLGLRDEVEGALQQREALRGGGAGGHGELVGGAGHTPTHLRVRVHFPPIHGNRSVVEGAAGHGGGVLMGAVKGGRVGALHADDSGVVWVGEGRGGAAVDSGGSACRGK